MTSENFEKTTSGIKNCFQLAVIAGVLIFVLVVSWSLSARQWAGKLLDDMGIESGELAGLKINRKLAQGYKDLLGENQNLKLQIAGLTTPKEKVQPRDAPAPIRQTAILSKIDEEGSSWVYLGPIREGRFLNANFDLKARPDQGEIIAASTDVFKRARKPYQVANDEWRLGEIKGVVEKGEKVKVIQIADVEGDDKSVNLWAEVRPITE